MLENQEILEYKDYISLVISLVSIFVALMAYSTTKELSKEMNLLTERSLRSGNLSKYSNELNLLRANLEPKIKVLHQKASLSYLDIINEVDLFGSKPPSRHLRHVTHKIVVLWFNNFCYELNWQTALNLYGRMREIFYVQPDELERGFLNNCVDFFERKYRNKLTTYFKRILIKNNEFNDLLTEYFNHLDNSVGLYQLGMEKASPVFEDLFSLHDEIRLGADKLDRLLEENEIEEVSLQEAPRLKREIESYIAKLRILENINLLENTLRNDNEFYSKNQILVILFCLHLIESYRYWGRSVHT